MGRHQGVPLPLDDSANAVPRKRLQAPEKRQKRRKIEAKKAIHKGLALQAQAQQKEQQDAMDADASMEVDEDADADEALREMVSRQRATRLAKLHGDEVLKEKATLKAEGFKKKRRRVEAVEKGIAMTEKMDQRMSARLASLAYRHQLKNIY